MIKKLLEKIGLSTRCNKVNDPDFPYNKSNYICFIIDPANNEPMIKVNIADISDAGCLKYSEMIFNMAFGMYQKNIANILQSLSKQDSDIDAFVQNLTINLDDMVYQKIESKNNVVDNILLEPLIRPTTFQNHGK